MQKKGQLLEKKIAELAAKAEVPQSYQNALIRYQELIASLDSITGETND